MADGITVKLFVCNDKIKFKWLSTVNLNQQIGLTVLMWGEKSI